MRIRILVILFILIAFPSFGQDLPDLTNYQHNWLLFNPAFTGSRDVLSASFFSRDNAITQPGTPAPKHFQVAVHSPFDFSESDSWGVSYYNQKMPGYGFAGISFNNPVPMVDHNLTGYYAHKVRVKGGQLSLGLSAIIANKRIDNAAIDVRQPLDPLYMADIDPEWSLNFGAGALFYTEDQYAGLSVPRLLNPIVLAGGATASSETQADTDTVVTPSFWKNYNIMFTAGHQFALNPNLTIYPSFLLGYIPIDGLGNLNYMASLNFGFMNEKIWFGTIYKSGKEIAFNVNLEILDERALIGLSWDFSLARTVGYFDNAFEIVFRWDNIKTIVSKAPFYF